MKLIKNYYSIDAGPVAINECLLSTRLPYKTAVTCVSITGRQSTGVYSGPIIVATVVIDNFPKAVHYKEIKDD